MTSDRQIASILHLKVDLPNALFLNSVSIVTFERDVHFYMGFGSVDPGRGHFNRCVHYHRVHYGRTDCSTIAECGGTV